MTAVEWLRIELEIRGNTYDIIINIETLDEILKQAKEMEKQQIIDAWHKGYDNQSPMIDEENCGQTYYNETYGSKGSGATSSQTEISDEEIWKASINYDNGATYETPIVHFQQGAFWYREQLKQL